MRRTLWFAWKAGVGAFLCQSFLGSILVVGWVQRVMQRSALRHWHKRSDSPLSFDSFAAANADTAPHQRWPGWIVSSGERRRVRDWVGALWANASRGATAIFNTWVLTLPACTLWLFAWYDGWNNSFTKGYEQAAVGPLTGLLGVALFIAAMLYVPLAQARQASTGSWRSFYEFSLVFSLIRRRWWACVRLAALYALVSLPVMLLKTAPVAFDRFTGYEMLGSAESLALAQRYFLLAGALVFGLYIAVRATAARVYAGGVLDMLRDGVLAHDRLGALERSALGRLDLLEPELRPARPAVLRAVGGVSLWAARIGATAVAVVIWFAFVAQIFVSEFLNYHPVVGWMNQPLVQLPWFDYIPTDLG